MTDWVWYSIWDPQAPTCWNGQCGNAPLHHKEQYVSDWGKHMGDEWYCPTCGEHSYTRTPEGESFDERNRNPQRPQTDEQGNRSIQCPCGQHVPLWSGWANQCEQCGREYNGSGQALAPRSQWGAETGEDFTDPELNYQMQWGTAFDPKLRGKMPGEEDVPSRAEAEQRYWDSVDDNYSDGMW